MNIWPLNNLSNEEKNDILSKHRYIYDGYRAVNPTVSNEQPLYVQDFAKDKDGIVINNKGEVKKYTNFAINESEDKGLCTECGGQLYEGECMECGSKMYEEECMECGDKMYEDIYDEEDINLNNEFDYTNENDDVIYELEIEDDGLSEEDDSFDFEPMESAWGEMDEEEEVDEMWAAVGRMAAPIAVNYAVDKLTNEEDIEEEIDDDLKESFKSEKSRIMEMMNRMNVL
jgi:hypothetical protein